MLPSDRIYAVADLAGAKRIGGGVWLVGAVLILVLLPLSDPHGATAWIVLAVAFLGALACAYRLGIQGDRVSPNELYLSSFLGPVAIAGLVWAGGASSPYGGLFLLSCLYTGSVHPPRRVLAFLPWFAAAVCAPLVYNGWSDAEASAVFGNLAVWIPFTLVAMVYTMRVRRLRLDLVADNDRAVALARLDALTSLGNRRAFDEDLGAAISVARETVRPLSVVVADLEDFKRVNDGYGHLAGDAFLRSVAEAISGAVRDHDRCYRWGGDEFAVLLPGSAVASAEAVCARIAEAVALACITPDGAPLRLECGAAELAAAMDARELVAAADAALLDRKAAAT